MRTNIEIDDQLMSEVLAAGTFKTKKEAVEAGLVLLKRQAAMRELAKMGGTLTWGWGDEERLDGKPNWSRVEPATTPPRARHIAEPVVSYSTTSAKKSGKAKSVPATGVKARARR